MFWPGVDAKIKKTFFLRNLKNVFGSAIIVVHPPDSVTTAIWSYAKQTITSTEKNLSTRKLNPSLSKQIVRALTINLIAFTFHVCCGSRGVDRWMTAPLILSVYLAEMTRTHGNGMSRAEQCQWTQLRTFKCRALNASYVSTNWFWHLNLSMAALHTSSSCFSVQSHEVIFSLNFIRCCEGAVWLLCHKW